MIEIVPAIMPKDHAEFINLLRRLEPHAPCIQIDILDGEFVEGEAATWPYTTENPVELPRSEKVEFEVDLMIHEPERVVAQWSDAGAKRIIVHVESTQALDEIIDMLGQKESKLGLAINTTTPLETLAPYIGRIDFVQCMGIAHIGKQGEPFDDRVIVNLRALHAEYPDLALSVDGGVRLENAKELVEAGANRLVSGSAILKSEDIRGTLKKFHAIVGNVNA